MAEVRRYLRIGEEKKFGEETEEYAETLDPEEASLETDDEDKLVYEGMSGLDRTVGLGVYTTSGDIVLPVDDEATAWFWKWLLGGYEEPSESSSPYTHKFFPDLGATMTSFSAAIGKDITEHIFLGNVIEELEVEIEDEWALMTVSCLGSKDKLDSLQSDVKYTDGQFFAAPRAQLRRDPDDSDEDLSADVNSLTMTISTEANVEDSAGFGSRFPTKATQEGLEVELEMELWFSDLEHLKRYWGDSSGPTTECVTESEYLLSFEGGCDKDTSVDFTFPRVIYQEYSAPADGREGITQTITARALYDNDEGSGPVEISVTNDRESYAVSSSSGN